VTGAIELWRPVVGYESRYEVSSLGRVKSLARIERYSRILNNGVRSTVERSMPERILAASRGSNGYLTVRLQGKTYTVHSLVLTAFKGPKAAGHASCHCDGNKENNRKDNLRWDTYAANNRDRFKHGMMPLDRADDGRFLKQRTR
jgi:hypothetical protein